MLSNYYRLIHISFKLLFGRHNIAKTLEELGPAFIKLGQFLSTRPDLIGDDLATSFSYLRDALPSFPFKEVQKTVKEEFGKDISDIFSEFSQDPVAAASVAQVHYAKMIDGKNVAVKVRRPNIQKILATEIKFFYFVAKKLEWLFPKYKRLKLIEIVKTLEDTFKFELDLRLEAAAADELLENNKLEFVRIPKIDWLHTSERIITMEWIEDAVSIYDREQLIQREIDLVQLATNFTIAFLNQAFTDGFFHADLHQGNILIDPKGKIVLLDFGIMGRLGNNDRVYIAQILYGFLKKDYMTIAKIHHQAKYVSKKYMAAQFAQSCRSIGEPIMNLPPNRISIAKLLGQLFKITEDYQMETQPQLLLLQKSMIMVEGIGKSLCQEKNIWILAEPWIKEWAKNNLSAEARAAKAIKNIAWQVLAKLENNMSF